MMSRPRHIAAQQRTSALRSLVLGRSTPRERDERGVIGGGERVGPRRALAQRGEGECQGRAAEAVAERSHLVDDLGVHARRSSRAANYTALAARFRRAVRRALTSRWNSSGKQGFMRYETAPTASAECLRYALKSCPVRMITGMVAVSARL